MSDPRSEGRLPATGDSQPGPVTRILLPYALGNMVFLQAAPCWLLLFVAGVGSLFGFIQLFAGNRGGGSAAFVAGLVVTFLAGALLVGLRLAVWRPAREGRYVAIVLLYVLHVLLLAGAVPFASMVIFVFAPIIIEPSHGGTALVIATLIGLAILAVMWIIAATNLFERDLWTFAHLDGQCPVCRSFRFGRIRRPCSITCVNCGAVLRFECPE
jgi:hypothetical protein